MKKVRLQISKCQKRRYSRLSAFQSERSYRSVTFYHLAKRLIIQTTTRLSLIKVPKVKIRSAVGIDVGLESFLTTSDGDKIGNPRYLRKSEAKLKTIQRQLSKRKKESHRRWKMRLRLRKLHERIANQRRDFHFKIAHWLYEHNGYDLVACEDLQIRNMMKNHCLAKSISDAGWGQFVQALGSKAEKTGYHLEQVDPKYTSQKCSACGEIVKKSLSVRTHSCDCGLVLDRDENAAINILAVASTVWGEMWNTTLEKPLLTERSEKSVSPQGRLQASSFRAG